MHIHVKLLQTHFCCFIDCFAVSLLPVCSTFLSDGRILLSEVYNHNIVPPSSYHKLEISFREYDALLTINVFNDDKSANQHSITDIIYVIVNGYRFLKCLC